MKWCIVGGGLPDIYVFAETFDEALKKARRIDKKYCGGYIVED